MTATRKVATPRTRCLTRQVPRLCIRHTKKYGKGVFAGQSINKGQTVMILTGEPISFAECERRINAGVEMRTDTLQIGLYRDLDLDELSRTANHSCNPTCGMRGVSKLFALRNIRKGEEITYDYSATTGPIVSSSIWTMNCICGARNCRKIIGNVLSIPEKQLNKYKKSGALQNYIVQELRRIRTTISGEFVLPKYKKIPVGGPPKRR